jgi:hypothetical protein
MKELIVSIFQILVFSLAYGDVGYDVISVTVNYILPVSKLQR